jgi:hypothetical protein
MTLYEAIPLQPPFHFFQRYRFLTLPLGDDGEIMKVFQKSLILLQGKKYSGLFTLFVYHVLSLRHVGTLTELEPWVKVR